MSKYQELKAAYDKLQSDYRETRTFITSVLIGYNLVALAQAMDAERQPVADKAARIWDGSTAAQEYLRRKPADIIRHSSDSPFQVVALSDLIGQGWLVNPAGTFICDKVVGQAVVDPSKFSIKMEEGKDGNFYAAGFGVGVAGQLAAAIAKTELAKELRDPLADRGHVAINATINFDGKSIASAVAEHVFDVLHPLRKDCADAAEWLWSKRYANNTNWFKKTAPSDIVLHAKSKLACYNERREPSADKALFVYFNRVGTTDYLQEMLRTQHQSWIDFEYEDLIANRRKASRAWLDNIAVDYGKEVAEKCRAILDSARWLP